MSGKCHVVGCHVTGRGEAVISRNQRENWQKKGDNEVEGELAYNFCLSVFSFFTSFVAFALPFMALLFPVSYLVRVAEDRDLLIEI